MRYRAIGGNTPVIVVICAPHDLGQSQVLDSAGEEDVILGATAGASRSGL